MTFLEANADSEVRLLCASSRSSDLLFLYDLRGDCVASWHIGEHKGDWVRHTRNSLVTNVRRPRRALQIPDEVTHIRGWYAWGGEGEERLLCARRVYNLVSGEMIHHLPDPNAERIQSYDYFIDIGVAVSEPDGCDPLSLPYTSSIRSHKHNVVSRITFGAPHIASTHIPSAAGATPTAQSTHSPWAATLCCLHPYRMCAGSAMTC